MRLLRFVAPALVAVLVLAACGSSSSKKTSSSATTSAAAAPTTAAAGAAAGVKTADTKLGTVLVDSSGRTLYHRTDETATNIKCTAQCATTWPPLLAGRQGPPPAASGVPALTVVMRPEGTDQVAAGGQPLYYFAADTKPGDQNGEGVGGIWHVVKATGTAAGSTGGSTGTPTTAASSSNGYGY